MGYSKNLQTLHRRMHLLEYLKDGAECEWPCETVSEKTLAYQIREALHIAENVAPDKYPDLARAARDFTIRETGEGRVIATRKEIPEPQPLTNTNAGETNLNRRRGQPLTAHGNLSLTQLISLIKTAPSERLPFHFPSTTLENDDLLKLHKWIQQNTNYLLFWTDESLTIHEHSEELETLAFSPEDLLEESEK